MLMIYGVKEGDTLIADNSLACIKDGDECIVKVDSEGLYVKCLRGNHYLKGHRHKEEIKKPDTYESYWL